MFKDIREGGGDDVNGRSPATGGSTLGAGADAQSSGMQDQSVPYIPPDRQISSAQGQVHIKIGDYAILSNK